ncbi:MAG TPA: DNA-directed RNA polymerase subunit H [Candidatus Nanoarchaeia archaeon]|nr:DNA-directed RNA polymerase subunit H [Candidatus Nanoarchaeia archaeon]
MSFNVTTHQLVCKHSKVADAEKEALLKRYEITQQDLPKIMLQDPAIKHLGSKAGDVIKVERESKTAGKSAYYREVIEG